ncbi:alpha/beta hydrolase [Mycolicibacterium chitae]|uniref:Alpha/beta hydrolase fold protein n=1 Tax=Mycolicibacterium chitae TaxID=1792 RepID=A0A3S4RUU5_MYCCI|nr:alpha/beta hydrolase [Mycolicibacterium chitae]MCV7108179.1 alpha/beta hydrolase [Mycolicibacterium chitae]BBZ05777.1 alpha/beta hydrolase [Mycolicibacterium chitae]VEG49387.1 alpha/beta hydrolase fold protein [Mycolicibacterium chitae]
MSARRWLAGVAGLGTVGAVAGVSTARSLTRRTPREDPYLGEDFTLFDTDRSSVVTTPDGVDLAVREVGPADAPVTVVFVHGFCMGMGSFYFQRRDLAPLWGDQVRMVFYDQRGHGRSGIASYRTYTVEQLGQDLDTVLTLLAPTGPVILIGHSMGGMTVLSHARQFPQHYGKHIVGAALISTAAEGLSRSPIGEILQNPALEMARFATRYAPSLLHRGRGAVRTVLAPILQAASFGDDEISPTVARYTEAMIHDTPVKTMVGFLHALGTHDEADGLTTLAGLATLVACGSGDVLTTPEHSAEMAAVLPKSELLVIGDAGHLVQLEEPEVINDALARLVDRATPGKLVAMTRRLRDRARSRG